MFDGVGEDGYRRSFEALKPGGLLCAYGYSANVQPERRLFALLMWIARVYVWRRVLSWLHRGQISQDGKQGDEVDDHSIATWYVG